MCNKTLGLPLGPGHLGFKGAFMLCLAFANEISILLSSDSKSKAIGESFDSDGRQL